MRSRFGSNGFDVRRLDGSSAPAVRGEHLPALLLHFLGFVLYGGDDGLELFDTFQEISNIQESVAIQPDFDEGRLHARQHAGDAAFVDAAD